MTASSPRSDTELPDGLNHTFATLAAHEQAIGQLYRRFAAAFKSHAEFWNSLADDEDRHVIWVNSLATMAREGRIKFVRQGVDPIAVKASARFVQTVTRKLAEGRLTLLDALVAASKLEGDAIDGTFFEAFNFSGPQGEAVLRGLEQQSDEHQISVLVELNKVRRGIW